MAAKVKVESYEEYVFSSLCTYAGIDCIVTLDLLAKIFPEIADRPLYRLSREGKEARIRAPSLLEETENIKMPAHEFILDMEINGFMYDVNKNRELDKAMREDLRELETRLEAALSPHVDYSTLNLDSGPEIRNLLYNVFKFEVPSHTKSGDASSDGAALKSLHEKYGQDWLMDLKKRNDIASVHSSFIATYIDDWVKSDGCIHPQYNLTGTSSHRISSDSPNLLNLPRMCYQHNIRSCYTVQEGYIFLALDFSSCEVKVLGALSKDPKLLKAIEEGKDFHSYTACLIHGLDYDTFVHAIEDKTHPQYSEWKEFRQQAKAVTFGLLYGSTTGGVAAGLGISNEEAQVIIDAYFDAYPKIKEYIEDAHNMALWNQFVFTPFGQRKMQFGTLPPYTYTAVKNAALRNAQNFRIQSTASTLGLITFAKLNEEIKKIGGKAICTVYDSIELAVPINRAAEALEIAFYCMDDWPVKEFSFLDLPIGADAEIGYNWGDIEKVHRGTTQEEIISILRELDDERTTTSLQMAA